MAFALSAALPAGLRACQPTAANPTPDAARAGSPDGKPLTYADTAAWDGEYDVVVTGMGFAGSTAAIEAANNGAGGPAHREGPEGEAGGNSQVCHQLFATVDTVEGGTEYYSAMRGEFTGTGDEMLTTFLEGMTCPQD